MSLITISEFKQLSCLSDRALIWLLERNLIELVPGPHSACIDIESIKIKDLIKALSTRSEDLWNLNGSWIEERVASVCISKLEEVLELALAQAERL